MTVTRYTPQVGDRIRNEAWEDGQWLDVHTITRKWLIGDDQMGAECVFGRDRHWVKVETLAPLPEMWISVRDNGEAFAYDFPIEVRGNHRRIAVVHIWTDSSGVDHAEIERVTA